MFIWPSFERSVSGPGWDRDLNCRVSILDPERFPNSSFSGVWRSAGRGFLPWRQEWQASTMMSAIRWQSLTKPIMAININQGNKRFLLKCTRQCRVAHDKYWTKKYCRVAHDKFVVCHTTSFMTFFFKMKKVSCATRQLSWHIFTKWK